MRSKFDQQLALLNDELTQMGETCAKAICLAAQALEEQNASTAAPVTELEEQTNEQERSIEALCLKLLLQQQPVARDLRVISAALKMITDMERIGDHATDISEITIQLADQQYIKEEFETIGLKLRYKGINTFNGALEDNYKNLYKSRFYSADINDKSYVDKRRVLDNGLPNPNRDKRYWILEDRSAVVDSS